MQELDQFRLKGDPLADRTFLALYENGFYFLRDTRYADLIYNNQKIPSNWPSVLQSYFKTIVDGNPYTTKIRYSSVFFSRYQDAIMLSLGMASLPYCYAAANGVQVLYQSERLKKDAQKRLEETAAFVRDVLEPRAFENEGKALISIAKVRLMHAAVRYYVQKSDTWNPKWGKPINQEDMAGTNLSFSLIVIRALRKLGFTISPEEAFGYIQHWNIIGQLMGIDNSLLPNSNQEAYWLDKLIVKRQFKASKEGKELTQILLRHIAQQLPDEAIDVASLMYYLLGEEIAHLIDLQEKNKLKKFIYANFALISRLYSKIFTRIDSTGSANWHAKSNGFVIPDSII